MIRYNDIQKIKHIHAIKVIKELSQSYNYNKDIFRNWCCGYIVTIFDKLTP